jgi:hypothetical protein
MKFLVLSLVVGLGLLGAGCASTHLDGEGEQTVPFVIQRPIQQAPVSGAEGVLPPASAPGSALTPPAWYWMEQPKNRLDQQLQQQWNFYNQNRMPAPQFPRTPVCQSIQMNGQIVTNCY